LQAFTHATASRSAFRDIVRRSETPCAPTKETTKGIRPLVGRISA